MNNTSNSKLHPMIMAAAAAVVLVSGVGVAAIMGWLPSSNSQNQDPSLAPNGQPLVYELDADLKPLRSYYLGDADAIAAAMQAVASQGRAK